MIATQTSEYRQLALDSSNSLMDWDAGRALGRHEEAAVAVRRAGELRRQMGQLCLADGDYPQAAADWLSAAACFVQATAADEAEELVHRVTDMVRQDQIPAERKDIWAALSERQEEVRKLRERVIEVDR